MNQDIQDRIDQYLLHGDTMSEEDKAHFLKEIEEDAEKRDQYEFTKNLKAALVSRDQKLKAIAEFQQECKRRKPKRRNLLLWISGLAAGVRAGGRLMMMVRKLNVRAMYNQIPEKLFVDVTALQLGKTIKAGDLHYEGLEMVTPKEVIVCAVKMTRAAAAAAAASAE